VDDANGYNVKGEAIANQMELVVVDNLSDYLDYQPNKILVSADPSVINQYSDAIQNPFLDSVDFVKSAPFYLEIIVKDTNKGSSLQYLSNLLNIDQTEVMAIGDNYNDVSMIEYAGLGVAMGQADEIIKRKSQYITDTNDENGVAKALKQVFN
jgi:Cof subfamily protein (haloacid dehalogenase superfamily)